jgi:hypothetical protein
MKTDEVTEPRNELMRRGEAHELLAACKRQRDVWRIAGMRPSPEAVARVERDEMAALAVIAATEEGATAMTTADETGAGGAVPAEEVHAIDWSQQSDIRFACDGVISEATFCADPKATTWRADNGRRYGRDEDVTCVRCHQAMARARRVEGEKAVAAFSERRAAGLPLTLREQLAAVERERDDARRLLALAAVSELPTCLHCDNLATRGASHGERPPFAVVCDGCFDECGFGPAFVDLPYAATLRAAVEAKGGGP